jgi:hypothetical protein
MKQALIRHKGYIFEVEGNYLHIKKGNVLLVRLCVAPLVKGERHNISEWQKIDTGHLTGKVKGIDARLHIKIDHGYVCFHIETKVKHFSRLHYFTEGWINGEGWQTYLSDVNDCFRKFDIDAEVPISSCFDGLTPDKADGQGMTDPGDVPPTWIWNVPIRAFSFHTRCGWLGISLPGPLPVGVTRLVMKDGKFSLLFEELRPSCEEGMMPHVYFITGLKGAYDALEAHKNLSMKLGWMKERPEDHPKWWALPTYKPAIDLQIKLQDKGLHEWFNKNERGEWGSLLTTKWLKEHMDRWLKECRLKNGTRVLLDQIFMYGYGSKRIIKELGGVEGFRKLIDEWRKQKTYLGLYFHPFFVGKNEPFFKEHPECFCKPKDSSTKIQWCDTETLSPAWIDWTHPEARRRQMDYIEFLLSDNKGCLNCDWLAINNAEGPDPRKYYIYDPDWAIGDLLQYKVHRMIYEKVKEIKPSAMLRRIAAGDCYLQPFIDQVQLIEHWPSTTDDYYKRGQIFTRVTHQMLINTDSYFCSQTKGQEFFMGMLVWNMPEFGGFTKAMHPYGRYCDLPLKDQRRRISGVQAYLNAPQRRTDICHVTWDRDHPVEQWRKRTKGPLAGWYASLAISPRCFVTYSETCARIGSSESRYADIPLPPNAKVKSVVQVGHEGGEKTIEYRITGPERKPAVRLKVADCGFETLYTEIRYQMKKKGSVGGFWNLG